MKFVKIFAFSLLLPAPVVAADFHGYPCTQDCSGHRAGYEWAERKGVTDPDDVPARGNADAFSQDCAWYSPRPRGGMAPCTHARWRIP